MARPIPSGPVMSAVQGGEMARQAGRQRLLDMMQQVKMQEEMAFKQAVEDRKNSIAQATLANQGRQVAVAEQGLGIKRDAEARNDRVAASTLEKNSQEMRQKAVAALMPGWKPYSGTDKVGQAAGPLRDTAEANAGYMHDNGLGPDRMNPADPGRLLEDAKGIAGKVNEQERQDAMARAHASGARVNLQERKFQELSEVAKSEIKNNAEVSWAANKISEEAKALGKELPGFLGVKLFEVERRVGAQSPRVAAFVARTRALVSSQVKTLSGAAASDQERAFIEAQNPNDQDTVESLLAKAEVVRQISAYRVANRLRVERAGTGRDMSGYEREYNIRVDDYPVAPWMGAGALTGGGGSGGTVLTPGGAAIKAKPVKGF